MYIHSIALAKLLDPYWQPHVDEAWLPILPGVLALGVSGLFIISVVEPVLAGHSPRDIDRRCWHGVRLVRVRSERRWLRELAIRAWGAPPW